MTRWTALAGPDTPVPPGAVGGPDLPGSVGGTGATWDATGDEPPTGATEALALTPVRSQAVPLDGRRVKRTLLLTVREGTPAEVVERFEADLTAMPEHITSIRGWALSRVDQARTPSVWTHVWEQEFADVEGLTGEYLMHPYHWTYVDRWFDGEQPGSIVEPRLAHVFRWADGPVLS
ncbi:Dabb family protein [Yinghuangia seranimata]|uniref:Dabb family protein n=1 Tax=Yinghuangia seranimata TaxID=408067 RepID=UPI00248C3A55|nr:Dabb family protein [Yinghuangia seranimata]MDI2131964.1 Dabb family protein [Yinghuangia seranimata]